MMAPTPGTTSLSFPQAASCPSDGPRWVFQSSPNLGPALREEVGREEKARRQSVHRGDVLTGPLSVCQAVSSPRPWLLSHVARAWGKGLCGPWCLPSPSPLHGECPQLPVPVLPSRDAQSTGPAPFLHGLSVYVPGSEGATR